MRRTARLRAACLLLFCLLLFCLPLFAVPASADAGPKPELAVRVVNSPAVYYLDLLYEGEGGCDNLRETRDSCDPAMLAALPAEAVVVYQEIRIYRKRFVAPNGASAAAYAWVANLTSLLAGYFLLTRVEARRI